MSPVPVGWTFGPSRVAPDVSLCDLIAAQAARTPDAPAVRQWGVVLTYRELLSAAGALAVRLRALGVGPETRVGLCARRTPFLPVAALGVMLAGGAYVPLDPGHPRRRLQEILDDASIPVVVVDGAGRALLDGCALPLVAPEADGRAGVPQARGVTAPQAGESDAPKARDIAAPQVGDLGAPRAGDGSAPGVPEVGDVAGVLRGGPARPGNAAYVLYTSGSTGRPKGVVVDHASAAAFVSAAVAHFGLDGSCRSIAFSALGFDVSVLDMFAPLTAGGCVQLVPDEDRVDPARLQRFLEAHEVTWGFVPPALLPLVDPAGLPQLRDLVTAGEPPGPEQVARWSGRVRFHNWYGPTETTVCVVGAELSGVWDRPLPIGRPLGGCRAHVLDGEMRECLVGVEGELYIGGPQVSRGYLGRPGLTAERFVPDPFGGGPGARLYRTGDRVAWQEDGRIAFMGRLDRQVKVQGQRVEIGEVESVVRAHPGVLQAVVDAPGELVAYVAPLDAPDLAVLREYCAVRLPPYMVPTRVVRVPALPLNASGKVDVEALRAADRRALPGGAAEGLAGIWARVLEAPDPVAEDDFFARGGHSLRAMRLVSAVRAELGRDISVEEVYAARTFGALASGVADAPPAVAGRVSAGEAPVLSAAQRRMWFVERLAPETPAHNIAMAERIRGPLDHGALRRALTAVVARHEALRWRIVASGGVPCVSVAPAGEVPLPLVDLSPQGVEAPVRASRAGRADDGGDARKPEAWAAAQAEPPGVEAREAELPEPESREAAQAEPPGVESREAALAELLEAEARTRFDLAAGPLLRARLVRLADDDHVLAVTVHHLVFDGWSQDVFYRDLGVAYRGGVLEPAGAGFADYVRWSRERADGGGLEWWRGHLRDAPVVVDLPRDAARPPVQTFRGAVRRAELDGALGGRVGELAARLGVTPYPVLLAAFGELLSRLSGQRDLVVGTPCADRGDVAFESLVGMCVRVLPLRLRLDGAASFEEQVACCRDELAAVVAHGDVPLDRVVEALRVPRDLGRNPVTQVLFNMYNFAEARLDLPGCTAEPLAAGLPGSLFDLTLYVSELGGGYALQLVYNPDLFSAARMDALLAGYACLLGDLLDRPDAAVERARLAAEPEPVPLPVWEGPGLLDTLHGDVVVEGAGRVLDRAGLASLRRRVAGAVRAAGVGPGEAVGVLAARVPELPGLLLGVLAGGARWVILDPAYPQAVLARQAAVAGVRAVVRCPGAPPLPELPEIFLSDDDGPADDGRADNGPADNGSADGGPAEVPYPERGYLSLTSGTTGDPKPVVTGEGPLAHFVHWYAVTFGVTPADRFALLSGPAHDPALRDLFVPLATGARLCVPERELVRDPARLAAWLREHRVTVLHLTPQLARMLCGTGGVLPQVRLVATGGDRLTQADAVRLRRLVPGARLVAFYGATETPQAHGWYEVPEDLRESAEPVPAGRGVEGSELVVLAGHGGRAGVGELGEVVVRSVNLADGYLDAGLTRLRFAPDLPGAGEPGAGEPGAGEPGAGEPGAGEPGAGEPGAGEPGAGEPGAGEPGAGEPGAGEPGAGEPGAGEPGAGEPGAGEPGAGEPGAGEPGAGEPGAGEPGAGGLGAGGLGAEVREMPGAAARGRVRVFRTGDLGRLNPDGTVTVVGRRDDQVKVRGFRVELGEVEAALAAHPEVRSAAAVVDRGEGREAVLYAYAVPRRPGTAAQRLLEHLRQVLPEHAVPAEVVVLAALPLTPNGKIDRAALRRPAPRPESGAGGELSGPTERAVAEVWRAVLGVPRVRPTDNFFEIGGHSLAIAAVQARLVAVVGREVPIVDLFRHPTIRDLAAHLDGGGHAPGLDRAARRLAVRRDRLKDRSQRPN
ncbi:non-ribosomal peptide synthetase [Streptosporangium sp. NBC_01756]|uniref:non-ribosomal peptide synthetase n=1 Tax=Streptosporangium sp. NBC_01756 TaxID=2975950 RepID=UPI002DD7BE61|nr:non-ribosomal peptide synthetase [Streptosporangium sp. NBC_01756]WSC85156.1 amino acid adenylation domain-containing protein [Streptosporangium sp. NBC_01756]